jgi:hypothetical protein
MEKGEGGCTTLNISNTAHASPRDTTRRFTDLSSDFKGEVRYEITLFASSRLTRKTTEMTVKTIAIPQAIKCAWTNMISCVNPIKNRAKQDTINRRETTSGGAKNMEAQCVKSPAQANLRNEGYM